MEENTGGFISTEWTYENLEGRCSACGKWIVANRATDLRNALPAVGMTFSCPECGIKLRISGDTANHPIDLLLFQVFPLKLRRLYTQCIFTLAQALEITMSVCVSHVLLANWLETATNETEAAEIVKLFDKRLRNMTLEPLRNLISKLAVHKIAPLSRVEAKLWIGEMNNLARDSPSGEAVSSITDAEQRSCVEQLLALTIGSLRNDVAHHLGRRPTEQEVDHHEAAVKPVVRLLLRTHGLTPSGGQLIVEPSG